MELDITLTVFTPLDVNWRLNKVNGYVMQKDCQWVRRILPLPTVIYDRFFTISNYAGVAQFRRSIRRRGIPLFNPIIGKKYEIYRKLARDKRLVSYLPETILFRNEREFFVKLNKWKQVYLKPDAGSKGRGIIRLIQGKNRLTYVTEVGNKQGRWMDTMKLKRWLKQVTHGQRYIAQQGLQPAQLNDRIFDLRILVQRDSEGTWQVTGGSARVANNGITCNICTGAQAIPLDKAFEESEVKTSLEEVHDVSLQVAKTLTKLYPRLGELGLDFLIDRDSRLWFLEANSRPGRIVFQRIGDHAVRRTSVRRPIEYALFLAAKRKAR
ncbi:YheC/YheD family protein [Heliobacterium chlorum]|uniref:YheC/YheD family protein n=1 Tax=Heliobacterium chlorum TaxID=2698 RepID=A0ABR7SZ60_HELCL|nr:YheC/YheD family protein [Heliobacterium chlorum]MBC9783823.1 YheC/YheD family protein [Heliobacterium chlorum]